MNTVYDLCDLIFSLRNRLRYQVMWVSDILIG